MPPQPSAFAHSEAASGAGRLRSGRNRPVGNGIKLRPRFECVHDVVNLGAAPSREIILLGQQRMSLPGQPLPHVIGVVRTEVTPECATAQFFV